MEGIALLRAYAGEFGDDPDQTRAFMRARFAEVRRLLENESLDRAAVEVETIDHADRYKSGPRPMTSRATA